MPADEGDSEYAEIDNVECWMDILIVNKEQW